MATRSSIAFIKTSCDPGEMAAASIADLRECIVSTLENNERLKHIRDEIPHTWLHLRESLGVLANRERVLTWQKFVDLCRQHTNPEGGQDNAITDENEQRSLLRLLNDLGVVVAHGLSRDAPAALREITLLDPNWLTGAIYTLLNSRTVSDQAGEFAYHQLSELLDPNLYPNQWHEYILSMIQHPDIGLCFELPGSQRTRYLIPEALPMSSPDYTIWPENSLLFRFSYDFLPSGLIPRFIVQAQRNLTDSPTRWRTGVVLGAEDCHILVRGDRALRRVDIFVAGPPTRQRSALSVVLNDLNDVHARNPEANARPLVPLPNQPECDVSYDHLLTLEARYGLDHQFDPVDADRSYTVGELLEGVRHERTSEIRHNVPYSSVIKTGDGSNITIFQGDPKIDNNTYKKLAEKQSLLSSLSWPVLSVAWGLGAVLVAIVLRFLPSTEMQFIVGGLIGLFVVVTAFMLSLNPKYFFRQWLRYVIPGGFFINALSFTLDVYGVNSWGMAGLHWDSTISGWFCAAWATITGLLIWGDRKQQR